MTMAAAGCKQGIILDRLWTALLLVSSKGPREASKLTKRPTGPKFDQKREKRRPALYIAYLFKTYRQHFYQNTP